MRMREEVNIGWNGRKGNMEEGGNGRNKEHGRRWEWKEKETWKKVRTEGKPEREIVNGSQFQK